MAVTSYGLTQTAPLADAQAAYVIAISCDGLGSKWLQPMVEAGELPNFKRLIAEGAWTYNARNDFTLTVTLPNHTTMLTSRGVAGPDGHNWVSNDDPPKNATVHSKKGSYVASVFDVAHDNGLRTGLFCAKTKFSLFEKSYDSEHGAKDLTGPDNGACKLDTFYQTPASANIAKEFIEKMKAKPFNFTLVHFNDGDERGHAQKKGGWGSPYYNEGVKNLDKCIGEVLDMVQNTPALKGRTVVILTADHGGREFGHDVANDPYNYTIPFGVWGAGVKVGADLYALNPKTRTDPGEGRPDYKAAGQPIRNGEVGNLSLQLLGLPPIPGSTINYKQNLNTGAVEPAAVKPARAAA
jgi:predicted AlkP superfamily pyrophosphatase or phosphodiesterase